MTALAKRGPHSGVPQELGSESEDGAKDESEEEILYDFFEALKNVAESTRGLVQVESVGKVFDSV